MKRFALKTRGLLATGLVAAMLPTAPQAGPQRQGPPPAPVRVDLVVEADLAATASATGTVFSRNEADLSAEATGRLTWVADVGTRVAAGDAVARIDNTAVRLQRDAAAAQVQRAQAQLTFLEKETVRLNELAAANNAAQSAREQTTSNRDVARADLAAARANLAELEDRLEKTQLVAPFNGVVTSRSRNIGERVQNGDTIVRLVDPDNLEVIARAPLTASTHVREGDSILLRNGDKREQGLVRTVVPFGDARNHLIELRIDIDASRWTVGEALRVAVPIADAQTVIAVPRDSLVLRREGAHVFRINDTGSADQVNVIAGAGSGHLVAVEGDLQPGDLVIVRGAERLRPGQPVSILNPEVGAGTSNQVAADD
ncbi:MAG: efflux RND transporter periplasmic adaptor subunit [Gammaproteobacteria bacterium]|nr:efflux RND transporter periplasmic adaptor subunit [Gammaproteobacteria bacterium]